MFKFSGLVLACAALIGGVNNIALAHGDKKGSNAPVVKEQTDWGVAGDAANVIRTVDVSMGDDMRFQPGKLEVKQGETIRFRVKNTGKLLHEFVIGTQAENAKHAELMLKFPGMEHDEPYMTHVDPGKTGEIVWTFIYCLLLPPHESTSDTNSRPYSPCALSICITVIGNEVITRER